jgi:hypothetical protein
MAAVGRAAARLNTGEALSADVRVVAVEEWSGSVHEAVKPGR